MFVKLLIVVNVKYIKQVLNYNSFLYFRIIPNDPKLDL
jgi:hypothetical protein